MNKGNNKKMVIIVMGPPGAGKGTQAILLAEKLDLYHLETAKIIEKNFENTKKGDFVITDGKKYFLLAEKKLRNLGKLMSPPLIAFWVKNKIKEVAEEGKGIVTSGAFRTLYECKKVIPFLKRLYKVKNVKVVFLQLSPKESIWRNSHRRICRLMQHPILYTKETAKLKRCPLDGSELVSRTDDIPEVIKVRLKEYKERTLPMLDYFKKEGLKVKKINGSPPPADVFKNVLRALKLK